MPAEGSGRLRRIVRGAASVAVAVLLLLYALPKVTGTGWADISRVLGRLTAGQIGLLTLVWVAGLLGYTWVLTGGLPGLTHAQALTLNVTSSAVSNLVPFGGALGVAVSYAMVRSWGFGAAAFALATLVTGIWNVTAKLALPVLALVTLVGFGDVTDRRLDLGAATAAVALALVVAALVGALSSERVAHVLGRAADRVAGRLSGPLHRLRHRGPAGADPTSEGPAGADPVGGDPQAAAPAAGVSAGGVSVGGASVGENPTGEGLTGEGLTGGGSADGSRVGRLEAELLRLRHRTVGLVRGRWHHLTFGMVAFLGTQAVLQWLCLRMLGSSLSPVQVFAAFAFGRLLTSLVLTPGGVGFSETGAAGLLVAFGGDPAVSASGVLLFSGFVYFLEIWVGGLGYAVWVLHRSWRRPVAGSAPSPPVGDDPAPPRGRMGS